MTQTSSPLVASHVHARLDQSHDREGQRNREYAEYGAIFSFAKRGSPRRNLRSVNSVSCYILYHFLVLLARPTDTNSHRSVFVSAIRHRKALQKIAAIAFHILILRVQPTYRKPWAAVCVKTQIPVNGRPMSPDRGGLEC